MPNFGVEEEFALLDPASGRVSTAAQDVIAACGDSRAVDAELMTYMVETRTPALHSVQELRDVLLARRVVVARQAARRGALLVATGTTPLGQPQPPPLTNEHRYLELAKRFPGPTSTAGTLGCHVHVAVPDRAEAVEVLRRTRSWIPALIALTANSPFYGGRETRWASWRYRLARRWPTGCPALPVESDAAYDRMIATAIANGDALDPRNVYYFVRLSPRYPTVEVRVADVLPTAGEAAAYAAIVRALVVQALDDARADRPLPPVDQDLLLARCAAAARGGLTGLAIDLGGRVTPGWALVDELLGYVLPSLLRDPAAGSVLSTVDLMRTCGGGADRQRQLWRRANTPSAFAQSLARSTTAPELGDSAAPNDPRTPGRLP